MVKKVWSFEIATNFDISLKQCSTVRKKQGRNIKLNQINQKWVEYANVNGMYCIKQYVSPWSVV